MTPSQIDAQVSQPTPIPERPTLYALAYPFEGGTDGWTLDHGTLDWCTRLAAKTPRAVVVAIRGSTPLSPPETKKPCGCIANQSCAKCYTKPEQKTRPDGTIECYACSRAGGADMPIFHDPPACHPLCCETCSAKGPCDCPSPPH